MKTQNLGFLAVGLVVGSIAGFFGGKYVTLKKFINVQDTPITVADGSLNFYYLGGKFDKKSDKEYSVKDKKGSTVSYFDIYGCGTCAQPKNIKLPIDNWKLTLNDGTVIAQDPQDTNRFTITLSASTDTPGNQSGDNFISLADLHFTSAVVTFGDDSTPQQTLTCPPPDPHAPKCQMSIHYAHN
jgi:hypothetical protein